MTQFVVYENTNRTKKKAYPYLLDIQSNLLNELRTTVVIPLCPKSIMGGTVISKLCPIFDIDNKDFIPLTQQNVGIDRKVLGKETCDLSHYRPLTDLKLLLHWVSLFLAYNRDRVMSHSTAQHSTAQHSTAQHSTAQHSTAQHSTAQHSTAQHSTAQHSTAQHSTANHISSHTQVWTNYLGHVSLT